MAHQWFRSNLTTTIFPFATPMSGRSIILKQYDQNYDQVLGSPADTDKDKGYAQAFYMHNVMPTTQGFMSISYDTFLQPMAGAPTDFDNAFSIQNIDLGRFIFVPAVGKNYIYDADVGAWASISPISNLPSTVLVTTAFVNAQSYIFYAGNGCYTYDDVGKVLTPVTLAGLTIANILGITNANGYMIAWTSEAVAWSSLTDPTNFVPSLATGAGGGGVVDAKGAIICCLQIAGGFLVYCEKNVVAARYTGNARFPYNFKELAGSGGIQTPQQVSWQGNLASHYSYTTYGMQKLDTVACENVVPEVTDFLSMLLYEDFDETSQTLTETYLSNPLNIKVAAVSGRFLVISYGLPGAIDFTYALVFDLVLKRWGKLKITHRSCFQWNAPNLYGMLTYGQLTMTYGQLGLQTTYGDLATVVNNPEIVRKTLCFLQGDGTVLAVDFNYDNEAAGGVLMIGKFQFQRNKFLTHQETDIENVLPVGEDITKTGNMTASLLLTLDGKTLQFPPRALNLNRSSPASRRYGGRFTGQNYTLLLQGAFNLTSFLTNFTLGGDR